MYNRELQVIDTSNKAYLLGLFYSDGNVSLNQHHSRLFINENDHIIKLKEKFPFFNIQLHSNYILEGLQSGIANVRKDLIDNGCLPAKSTINKDNLKLPSLNNKLMPHFIRGYYDGDGGCSLNYSATKEKKSLYIYSASKYLLEQIIQVLQTNNIECSLIETHIYMIYIKTSCFKKYYDYIYTNAELYLERKEQLLKKILTETTFFIKKDAPNCKFCNSKNTVNNGTSISSKRGKEQRILCKTCNRNFTITALISSNINNGEDELSGKLSTSESIC